MIMDDIADTTSNAAPTETVTSAPAADTTASTPSAAPDASAAPAEAPKSMVDAMFPSAPAPEAAKPADAAPVAEVEAAPAAGATADPQGEAEQKPDAQEDLTKMPEGLSAKAQERFQRLANENKDYKARIEDIESKIEPFRQSLQSNGVTGEQFSLATNYIGAINRGDFEGAYKIMAQELQQLSLMMGKSLGDVDALANFPDLRQAVDEFQVTEQRAMEIARLRQTESQQKQQQTAQQERARQAEQQQQSQRQQQEAINNGVLAIDKWQKQMEAKDMDFPAIEKMLLPKIQTITQRLPPHMWADAVQDAYDLIKAGAGAGRIGAPAAPASAPLRPTGSGGGNQQPKTMAEAMWGTSL